MSQRVAKVESLVQQVVARELTNLLEAESVHVTVTRVDVSPDLRNATVWVGLLGKAAVQERVWKRIEQGRHALQEELDKHMTTKFIPRLQFERDNGGEYAAHIDALLRGL